MRKTILAIAAAVLSMLTSAAIESSESAIIPLWPGGVPEATDSGSPKETISDKGVVRNVQMPTLEIFPARGDRKTGKSAIICPGGGYTALAYYHEGTNIARWLADNGITAGVLKYRLPGGRPTVPGDDAARAFEIMREKSADLGISPDSIGIIGSSAGGHLAATMLTLRAPEVRPAFGILIYPVVTMDSALTHSGTRENLLGPNPPDSLVYRYSCERQINGSTPSVLFLSAEGDNEVPIANTLDFARALKEHNVPVSLMIFADGGHAWGFRPTHKYHASVKALLVDWI
ncbi:MAG: alpha/beta hydrolase, partial [Muribaculaceae bacterium]|nr:alpha/beta hydrolase [Muribaculaceae bacterium]